MHDPGVASTGAIREALRVLGIRRLLLGIHDPAFPCRPEEDIGRGSPYSLGARDFFAFICRLGFTGVQLGPQGMTSGTNPSPYDGTLFSRNLLSLAPLPLTTAAFADLLRRETLEELVQGRPAAAGSHVDHGYACQTRQRILSETWLRFKAELAAGRLPDLAREFVLFRKRNGGWLMRDGLYEVLRHSYGGSNWRHWHGRPEARSDRELWYPAQAGSLKAAARKRALFAEHREAITNYAFAQFLLDRQHRELRRYTRHLGLELFGDLQIGFSGRDAWFAHSFLLADYVMGAPPSRTNPEGQPWNYPVLDPGRYWGSGPGRPGPALRFFRHRLLKMFQEFDGLRIDHPHGLVCPWVYRVGQTDPLAAVQAGARLFSSPDLPEHPELATFAIARPGQLNRDRPRHADDWVRDLEPEQVTRYALLFDILMNVARNIGRGRPEIACEILSTQPYPIQQVMERYGLGRFRVTQKADPENPADVYRSENAHPEDWIMLGNHDTPPIWLLASQWCASGASRQLAACLAGRLKPKDGVREVWGSRLAVDAGELVQAMTADLFASPAGNVMIYFTDLLGAMEIYNRPGTVNKDNWTLRITSDYRSDYRERLARNRAINIPQALALAIRAREPVLTGDNRRLVAELDWLAANPAFPDLQHISSEP